MLRFTTTWADQEPRHFSIPLPDGFTVDSTCRFRLSRDYLIATADPNILVYSLQDGRLLHFLQVHKFTGIRELEVYQDKLITVSSHSTFCIWDLVSGERLDSYTVNPWEEPKDIVILKPTMVEVERDDGTFSREEWPKELTILYNDGGHPGLNIWRLRHLTKERDFQPSDNDPSKKAYTVQTLDAPYTTGLAVSGRTAITGSYNSLARVWDIATGDCKWVLKGHTLAITSVDIDQKQAYTGSKDTTVRIWNLQTGECSHILQSPLSSSFSRIKISPSHLVSSYADGTLCIWDPTSGQLNYQLPSDGLSFFQHDDRKILYGSYGFLNLCDIHSGRLLKDLLPDKDVNYVAFRGRFCIAYASRDDQEWLEVWEFNDEDGFMEEESDAEDLDS